MLNLRTSLASNILGFIGYMASLLVLGFVMVSAFINIHWLKFKQNWWRLDKLFLYKKNLFQWFFRRYFYGKTAEEALIESERHYAEKHGFTFDEHDCKTEDGFILRMHRIQKAGTQTGGEPKHPVILQHGLFQSSGIFVTNEADSLAFYLASRGFDVWLGNNRCVFDGHIQHQPHEEEYWNWSLDDLAKYDFPAMIEFVRRATKRDQVIYVGHSQGNAQAFLGLSQNPALAEKIKLFVALAPAFYVVPPKHWALQVMIQLTSDSFHFIFGRKAFLPVMGVMQKTLHPTLFANLSFPIFSTLFEWGDKLWNPSYKTNYFRFTPRPISCKLLAHWAQILKAGGLHSFNEDASKEPTKCSEDFRCPIAVFSGSGDGLIQGTKLVERLKQGNVNVVHAEEIPDYEHMDLVWAKNAQDVFWNKLVNLFQQE